MSSYEILGLIATILVLVSFTQSTATRIRIINSIGSVFFVIYGLLISAWSVWILNACVIVVNIYKLRRR